MSLYSKRKIGIITQARMTSTRLPGKIMLAINGKSLLQYHVERLQQTGLEIALATTSNAQDDALVNFAQEHQINLHRGSETDVLQRFYETQIKFGYDAVVRVTSDCPLIDPSLILQGVDAFINADSPDFYVSNCFPRTFARGFDFEIFSAQMLAEAHLNATDGFDREHVTPYIWKNKSGHTHLHNIAQDADHSDLRLCVDELEDMALITALIEKYRADKMSYGAIENLVMQEGLAHTNAHIEQKKNQ